MSPSELTATERRVCAAFRGGDVIDLCSGDPDLDAPEQFADWGPKRTVRAEVLMSLLLGDAPAVRGRVPAVRIAGAYVVGTLDLAGGEVDAMCSFDGCVFEHAPELAHATMHTVRIVASRLPGLSASWAEIDGHLSLRGSRIDGRVELVGTQISGELRMNSTWVRASGRALSAGRLRVDGGYFGGGLRMHGGMRLIGAELNGGLFLRGARLDHPGGAAIDLTNARVQNAMTCTDGFRAHGTVRLRGARIDGRLSFRRAVLRSNGYALHATRLRVEELNLRTDRPIVGEVLLEHSVVGTLEDDPSSWASSMRLDGMTYEAIRSSNGPLSVGQRLDWLARDPGGFRPQPYEQLAAYLRRIGQETDARRVLIARQRRRRRTLRPPGRIWSYLLDVTVGYGYRPWIAGIWGMGLLALGSVVFWLRPPQPLKGSGSVHFNPVLYTLDLLSPIGGFNLKQAFSPGGWEQYLAAGLVGAGWVLAGALIASVSRVFYRD